MNTTRTGTVYVSGKITGLPWREARRNFNRARLELQKGWMGVVDPFVIKPMPGGEWADYVLRDLLYLRKCDAIYMMKNWKDSPGARVEHEFARGLGMEIIYEEEDTSE